MSFSGGGILREPFVFVISKHSLLGFLSSCAAHNRNFHAKYFVEQYKGSLNLMANNFLKCQTSLTGILRVTKTATNEHKQTATTHTDLFSSHLS